MTRTFPHISTPVNTYASTTTQLTSIPLRPAVLELPATRRAQRGPTQRWSPDPARGPPVTSSPAKNAGAQDDWAWDEPTGNPSLCRSAQAKCEIIGRCRLPSTSRRSSMQGRPPGPPLRVANRRRPPETRQPARTPMRIPLVDIGSPTNCRYRRLVLQDVVGEQMPNRTPHNGDLDHSETGLVRGRSTACC